MGSEQGCLPPRDDNSGLNCSEAPNQSQACGWSIWIFSSDCDRPSSPCTASAPSGLMWLTVRLAHKGRWGTAQLNKLLDLQSLEECWLTRTQLKRDWFIKLECSVSPNLSISLLCVITISKQESASTNETLVVTREPKMLLVTEGSPALDAHKEKPHERSPLLHRSWIRIWNSAGKDDLNKK